MSSTPSQRAKANVALSLALIAFAVLVPVARASCPAGRFVVSGAAPNDIVTDTSTGLVWQRTIAGSTYTQAEASSYCAGLGGGYRLPSIAELLSIVDRSRVNPAIDATAFPSTASEYFWSSSSVAGMGAYGWFVNFYSGSTYSLVVNNAIRVRCVR